MMRKQPRALLIALLVSVLYGCEEHNATTNDLLRWLNDSGNGLVKAREAAGVRWTAKYLPSDYLASRYLESLDSYTQADRDSAVAGYSNTICFLLTVESESNSEDLDVIYQNISSPDEFESRTMTLNFDVKDLVELTYGQSTTKAVISTMENTNGLSNRRAVMVVFAKDSIAWHQADTVDLVLDDRVFNSGIQHFSFEMKHIVDAPILDISDEKTN